MELPKLPNLKLPMSFFGSRDYKAARELYETAMRVWSKDQTEENWTRYTMAHLHMLQTMQQIKTRIVIFVTIIVAAFVVVVLT